MIVKTIYDYENGSKRAGVQEPTSIVKTITEFECDRVVRNYYSNGAIELIMTTNDNNMKEKTRHVIEDINDYDAVYLMNEKGQTTDKYINHCTGERIE